MISRPYVSLGVVALEELFKTSTEPDVLHDLQVELSYRTTSRAKKLLALVNTKLGTKALPSADAAILQIELEEFKKQSGLDVSKDRTAVQRLREAAEKSKI